MAAALPALKFAAPYIAQGVGSLIGKKLQKKSAGAGSQTPPWLSNPAFTKPMEGFGSALLPMAQQGFGKAFDYYGGVMNDPAAATASDAASIGRQSQQAIQQLGRQPQRGGASQYAASQIPQQQMAAGLERRQSAQQNAAQNIGNLASNAGGLGTNVFSNLLGNELGGKQTAIGQGYLDLSNRQFDWGKYSQIGGGIFDILTGKSNVGSNSPLGKLGGIFKGKLGGIFGGGGGSGSTGGYDPYGDLG